MSGLFALIGRAILTALACLIALASIAVALAWLSDGVIGEFTILVPVIAVFLSLTALEWIKEKVDAWRSKASEH